MKQRDPVAALERANPRGRLDVAVFRIAELLARRLLTAEECAAIRPALAEIALTLLRPAPRRKRARHS